MNSDSLRDDKEIRKFFLTLVKSHLDTTSSLPRIDLLSCPVAQNAEGKNLIDELSQLVEVCLCVRMSVRACMHVCSCYRRYQCIPVVTYLERLYQRPTIAGKLHNG